MRPVLSPQNGVRSTSIIYTDICMCTCKIYIYIHIYVGKPPSFKNFYGWTLPKIVHQTDLKYKWYNFDAVSLTKIEQYRL